MPAPKGVGLVRGGACSRGGVPVPGGGACSWGGCLVETPPDGYCCGRFASYWNAFLCDLSPLNVFFSFGGHQKYPNVISGRFRGSTGYALPFGLKF